MLAENLRRVRRERGISQEALALQADLDRTYVSSIERCRYAASIDVLERIANVLKVEVIDLLVKPDDHRLG